MLPLSVIVCAHNPRLDYLGRVLQALRNQTLPMEEWELLLIDNASTAPLSEGVDLTWHSHARHIGEPSLGLTYARLRGITEAKGPLLVFVDDDNVLKPDYLTHAREIAREHPNLGAWSGNVRLEFEEVPPVWTKPYHHFLVAREVSQDTQSRPGSDTSAVPYGAGMCVRREVGLAYRDQLLHSSIRRSLGRSGCALSSSEDIDIALTSCDMGMDIGLFARLELTHLVAPQRLSEKHLLGLCRGGMSSLWLLRFIRGQRLRRLPLGLKWWTKFLYDSARKRGRARRFYMAEILGKRDAWLAFAALETKAGVDSNSKLPVKASRRPAI